MYRSQIAELVLRLNRCGRRRVRFVHYVRIILALTEAVFSLFRSGGAIGVLISVAVL